MSPPLYIQGFSDTGRQREQNEDCFRVQQRPDGSWVLVVCDGMGGHEAGEVASAVASQRILEVLVSSSTAQPPQALYDALMEANQAVVETALARGTPGMGTTAVAAWVLGAHCYVGWVGDSRLYQFRRGQLIERSRDHTRVEQMVQHGILTPEQAKHHPDAHVLLRALGGSAGFQQGFKPEVWNEPLELQAGDVVLLCSDGLYDLIEDAELYPLIERRDCLSAVDTLIREANARGGTDNITAILLIAGHPDVPAVVGSTPAASCRDTLPGVARVMVSEPARPSLRGEALAEGVGVASVDASVRPLPRQTLPETPLVAAAEVPAPAYRRETLPETPGNSRRVSMWWALGLATGMLLVGGLMGWVFGRGSTTGVSGSAPGPARAASAAVASGGTLVGVEPLLDAGPSTAVSGAPSAPVPLPLAAPVPAVPPSPSAPVATPAPKPQKKTGAAAPPAPSRPEPATPGTPTSGSASGGQGT
jgi:protein phosphatase